jgi:hypothetical protein
MGQRPSLFRHDCRLGVSASHISFGERFIAVDVHGLKSADVSDMHRTDTRIANRAVITIEVISWAAIIIVMGMILSVIGTAIYGVLVAKH